MSREDLLNQLEQVTSDDVQRALDRDHLEDRDIVALLSRAAFPFLEALAKKAQTLTRQRFGRTIQLYAPIYLSNECVNRCTYCGFAHGLEIPRLTLTLDEVKAEAQFLHAQGFRHLLLVSGEHPRIIHLDYLEAVSRALRPSFDSLSLEVGTFDLAGYQRLVAAGIDGLTLYQETYQSEVYRRVHPAGPKSRFDRRIEALNEAGRAGFRSLGVGALLGLAPWQLEAFALASHARALTKEFWRSRVAVSFPRIRENAGGRLAPCPVTDRDLVHMICVMRLALPDAELVLSTREPATLRDHLMGLGITRMSAGSRTNPGGYVESESSGGQFQIEDSRSVQEVISSMETHGFDPVWKDFDRGFLQAPR